jgi:hypothetical protein
VIEGVLIKIRRKLHDKVVYSFHVSSPKIFSRYSNAWPQGQNYG